MLFAFLCKAVNEVAPFLLYSATEWLFNSEQERIRASVLNDFS